MASFRGHLAFGGGVAAVGTAAVAGVGAASGLPTLGLLFLACSIGAFLPDVDSDSSIPFYLVFGSTALALTSATVYATLHATDDLVLHIFIPLATLCFLWFGVGTMLKSLTRHRGIFHSLPALIIAGLVALLIANRLGADATHATLFGGAVSAGFLSHLVLDEIYSIIDFRGLPFVPNKAFGSALKLWSSSATVSIGAYAIAIALAYISYPIAEKALTDLLSKFI